jgi:thiosulfate/3-mercaptopyruvate sulfurtransferase
VGHLISPEALAAHSAAVVFDCRFSLFDSGAGRREYEAGHVPGARFADLERDLSSPPGPGGAGGRHPLPDRDELAARMRAWGVHDDSLVVCYDQNSGAFAGRLWWLTRWLGHANVCLLDGGLDAWIGAGLDTETTQVTPQTGTFSIRPSLTKTCSADDIAQGTMTLLDARDAARYRGESEPIDAIAGHIPGAVCAPFIENLDAGRFRSPDALAARFRDLGVDPEEDVACYCGSGVTATHNILALLLAGYSEPVLYPGSWSDWITNADRPIETG